MPGKLLRPARISREDLRANPDTLYVFGDNMQRRGLGGQAREMRGEPNAIGVPTKWFPDRRAEAYFRDRDLEALLSLDRMQESFDRLETHLRAGGTVTILAEDLDPRAELPKRAPRIHAYIESRIRQLEEIADA